LINTRTLQTLLLIMMKLDKKFSISVAGKLTTLLSVPELEVK
jgi:hypothetical protein